MGEWSLFSNHGHVLVCLANNHQARLRDVAAEVGITERAVQNILRELQNSAIVQVSKHGRCNHYQINTRKSLRHPLEAHCTVGRLLHLLQAGAAENSSAEVVVEPKPRVSKNQAAAKPGRTKTPAADASGNVQAEVTAPAEKAVTAQKSPPEIPATQATPDTPAVDEVKSANKDSKETRKKVPATDKQGSLF